MTGKTATVYARTPTKGKKGLYVDKAKYEAVRKAILAVLKSKREIAFRQLAAAVKPKLGRNFEGSVGWYTTTVKLDMEVRGEIERVPGVSPQRLRLKK